MRRKISEVEILSQEERNQILYDGTTGGGISQE